MSADTSIEWAHHTFNLWSGCTKISAGCANCYAAALPPYMRRNAEWGDRPRVFASDSYWLEPLKWNRAAEKAGERHRVFCASVADVFEDRPELDPHRDRLMALIALTPSLDWLLLTKRPHVAKRYLSDPGLYQRVLDAARFFRVLPNGRSRKGVVYRGISNPVGTAPGHRAVWWPNLWMGVSVENQEAADERVRVLVEIDARVRFLSCEPLLGAVKGLFLDDEQTDPRLAIGNVIRDVTTRTDYGTGIEHDIEVTPGISWVIVGCESGHKARPMHIEWARSLRDQCVDAGVSFFLKQAAWNGSLEKLPMLDGRTWDEVPE